MDYQKYEYGNDIVPPFCVILNEIAQSSLWDALRVGERIELQPHTGGRNLTPGSRAVFLTINLFGSLLRLLLRYAHEVLSSKLQVLHTDMELWVKEEYMLEINGEARALPTHEAYCLLAMSQIKEMDGAWDNCRQQNQAVARQHMHIQKSLVQASLDAWSRLSTPLTIKDRSQHPVNDHLNMSTSRSVHHAIHFFLRKMLGMVVAVKTSELEEDLKCPRCYSPRACEEVVELTLATPNSLKRYFTWCKKCAPLQGCPKVCGLTRVQRYEELLAKKRKREQEEEDPPAASQKTKKRKYLPRRRGLTQAQQLEQSALRLEMADLLIFWIRKLHPEYFEEVEE